MGKWRLLARVAGRLQTALGRATERAYAPGGRGFKDVRDDFARRAAKQKLRS